MSLGAGFAVTILELTQTITTLMDFSGRSGGIRPDRTVQLRRCLDTSRAEQLFGFRARVAFEDGLRNTIAWYRRIHESR
ncbi:GDP-L-fucose synthase, partial [bacterium AH-315-O15]|nr:GDP-L-fucose synthase [bacterium AH-315-O15]